MREIKISRGVYEGGVVRLTDPPPEVDESTESIVVFISGHQERDDRTDGGSSLVSLDQLRAMTENGEDVQPFSLAASKFFSLEPSRLGRDASTSIDAIIAGNAPEPEG